MHNYSLLVLRKSSIFLLSPLNWVAFFSSYRISCIQLLLVTLLYGQIAVAQSPKGFTAGVTPSRFELTTQSGNTVRRSLQIYNLGLTPEKYRVRTVDWQLSETGELSFQDALQENSCRPWVRLERHEVEVVPGRQRPRNFRFEIHVPDDAPKQECRFALMLDGIDNDFIAELNGGSISMPVAGRIAVIVYLGVNGVDPDVSIKGLSVKRENNQLVPVVNVFNAGDAHGRLDSDLRGTTPDGKTIQLAVAASPILPMQTRQLALNVTSAGDTIQFPMTVKGKIYSDNHTYGIETVLGEVATEKRELDMPNKEDHDFEGTNLAGDVAVPLVSAH